ncbi:MAG TPA: DNA lyase, partial [Burkholderiales bacterium]|nr:DNA lyase [Burkholderiales bacterium]
AVKAIPVTTEQMAYEWQHLLRKLAARSPRIYRQWRSLRKPQCHPLFRPRPGPVESWERT